MKILSKVEKKHWIAGAGMVVVAVVAFLVGTTRSERAETHPAETSKEAERKPAGNSVDEAAPSEEESLEEEEVEIQIAHHASHPAPVGHADHRGVAARLLDRYADAWTSIQNKVQSIQSIEDENKKLKLENAYLRVMAETGKFSCRSEEAKKKTDTVGQKLATSAGSKAARSIASIRYQFPENLLPEQLHALGVSYFKVKDDEKAAVIFNFLTELEDDTSYRNASNYLMAGIAFYRLDHFKNADAYFDKVAQAAESDEETAKAKRQAVYWKALVAERTKDRRRAQSLLLQGLENDPQAKEARWINPNGTTSQNRVPAASSGKIRPSQEGHGNEKTSGKH